MHVICLILVLFSFVLFGLFICLPGEWPEPVTGAGYEPRYGRGHFSSALVAHESVPTRLPLISLFLSFILMPATFSRDNEVMGWKAGQTGRQVVPLSLALFCNSRCQ